MRFPSVSESTVLRAYLAVGLAGVVAYSLAPGGVPGVAVNSAIPAFAAVAMAVGVRRLGRRRGLPWLAFAAGTAFLAAGDTLWNVRDLLGLDTPTPSIADGVYLSGYPLLALGLGLLVHGADRKRSRSVLIDSAIVTLALSAALWSPYFESLRSSGASSLGTRLTLAAYPTWDLLMLALAIRFVFSRALRERWAPALLVAVVLLLAADLVWAVAPGSYTAGGWLDRAWLLSYVLWGAAALHASVAPDAEAAVVEEGRSARQRFVVLAVPVVAMPITVVTHLVLGRGLTLVDAALGSSMLALVLLRFGSAIWSLDVASRELVERNVRLRESEERFRRLFEDAAVGLATVDAKGRIASVNGALCAIARASEAELVGRRFFDFVFPEDVDVLSDDFAAGFAEGRIGPLERRFRAVDGTEVWALAGLTVLPEQEVPLVVVNLQDISERRQFESELAERNRELEDADRFKNELLSVVSHDLRTPLTSIMGYLELALEDEHAIEGDRRGYLLVAQRNSERLYRLVEDLLFVSRAQAGHAALDLGVVEIGRVVGEVVAAALPVAAAGGVEIVCEREDAGTIVADEHRVAEAVENLVSNAVKFTPPGGRVDVRVEATGDAVAILVEDDGPGIDEDDRRRLFERFFRSLKSEGLPGAGLGLSIVKAIAETHGGSVSVESTLGHGATFELRLPRTGPDRGADRIGAVGVVS